jgi:heptosyltransferase I
MDLQTQRPEIQIDWVVEPAFAPLLELCPAVNRVIPCDLRKWRRQWWTVQTRQAWRSFQQDLQSKAYDAVIDLQGLSKSALISKLAKLSPNGKRYAMANRTEGSGYEAPTRWVADVALPCEWHSHALTVPAMCVRKHWVMRCPITCKRVCKPCPTRMCKLEQ